MKFLDLVSMCVRNLTRRKFRTFLTVAGVVIGTLFIVIMLSLGEGIRESYNEMLSQMGDLSIIEVRMQSNETPIDDDAVAQIQAMPGVLIASPTMYFSPNNSSMQLYAGRKDRYQLWPNFYGVYPESLELLGYTASNGDLELGESGRKLRVVIGPQVAYDFRDSRKRWPNDYVDSWNTDEFGNPPDPFFDPLETEMRLVVFPSKQNAKELSYDIEVSGIIAERDNDWESRYSVYISIEDLKRIKADYEKENSIKKEKDTVESYERVKVKVESLDQVAEVQAAISAMGFYTSSMEEMRENMQKSIQQIQAILGIIGGAALFVSAISIINTMLMSVHERTREIGIMKVLGCFVGNIRTLFLMEAGLIGFFGGAAGLGLSYLSSQLINRYGSSLGDSIGVSTEGGARLSIITPDLALLAMVVATVIGIVAGFYPANRAVRISALEAIKQE